MFLRSDAAAYQEAMGTPERAQRSLQDWLAWIHELEGKQLLKHPGMPLERTGKTVRGKDLTVTDGPFMELKDIVLGFIVVSARDLEHAVEIARGCPLARGGGGVEIRPVMSSPFDAAP